MIGERTIHRCTLFSIFTGLFTIVLMVVGIAMPYWSTGTFVSDDGFIDTSFHAGLFVYCPNNSTRGAACNAWDGNNQRTDALCYNYYSSDNNFQDMCENIFSSQALALTAISILFIAWLVRICALCCCPITWGRPRCCVRSCSSIAIALIVFLGLMLAVAAESLWSAAMTDLEVDTTIYSTKPNLDVTTSFGVAFVLMSLGTTICMMWLCTEVYMVSAMVRNRQGYQIIATTEQTPLLVTTSNLPPPYSPSTMMAPPPGYQPSVNAGPAGSLSVNAPMSMPRVPVAPVSSSSTSGAGAASAASGVAPAAPAAAAAGGMEPSAPVARKRFCGSCGAQVLSKFCSECGSPAP